MSARELLHRILRCVPLETLDLCTVIADDVRLLALEFGDEFEDIVHPDITPQSRFDLAGAQGTVAGVVTLLEVCAVAEFLFHGEGEDGFANRELEVDLVLGEAETCDVEEADVVDCVAELVCEESFASRLVEFERSRVTRSAQSTALGN